MNNRKAPHVLWGFIFNNKLLIDLSLYIEHLSDRPRAE